MVPWEGFKVLPKVARRKVQFGQFKGERLGMLPGSYLSYLSRTLDCTKWGRWAQEIMEARDRLGVHGGDRIQRPEVPLPDLPTIEERRERRRRENKYAGILKGCCDAKALSTGKWMHQRILKKGLGDSVFLGNLLVQMYGKCGSLADARTVFEGLGERRNVFSWTLMLAAYAQNGHVREARCIFDQMPRRDVVAWTGMISVHAQHGHHKEAVELYTQMSLDGMKPDRVTFISALDACSGLKVLAEGRRIHSHIVQSKLHEDLKVGTSLIGMYGKCGSPEDARAVFDSMPERNEFTLTVMIAAYSENGRSRDALEVFYKYDTKTDPITYIIVLEACANLSAVEYGRWVHSNMPQLFQAHPKVGTALVNMYSKCGSLVDARTSFEGILKKDVVSWTAIIAAYAHNGHVKEALELFNVMLVEGVTPNNVTFTIVLVACSHGGLLDASHQQFLRMIGDHGTMPVAENYMSMIDILARSGELNPAEDLILNMPFQPDAVAWTVLAGSCRVQKDMERGTRAAEHMLELDPADASSYISLSSMHSETGKHIGVPEAQLEAPLQSCELCPKAIPDVYVELKKKLVPNQIDVKTWLDYDVVGVEFKLVKHHLHQ